MLASARLFLVLVAIAQNPFFPLPAWAQAAGVPIEPKRLSDPEPALLARLNELKQAERLLSAEDMRTAMRSPAPRPVALAAPATQPLEPTVIAAQLRKSALRVCWFYLCTRCENWHLSIAGGYPLTSDGIASTCFHVLYPEIPTMREGYAIAMDASGTIYPITAVLAANRSMDVAIFQLQGAQNLTPLSLNDQTAPGERIFLLSDPSRAAGYFSDGIINRFYWEGTRTSGDPMNFTDATGLRMDVSTDWAPGSSGAPIVDRCGNVVGHVSRINTISPDAAQPAATSPARGLSPATTTAPATAQLPRPGATYVVLHEASPARAARLLIEAMQHPASTQPH